MKRKDIASLIVVAISAVAIVTLITSEDSDYDRSGPISIYDNIQIDNLIVDGWFTSEDCTVTSSNGKAAFRYLGNGAAEWRMKDLFAPYFVKNTDGTYSERGYDVVSNSPTLTIDKPGRYSIQLYVDSKLAHTGDITIDGTLEKEYSWYTQTMGVTSRYQIKFDYTVSDLAKYYDMDGPRHATDDEKDSRFAVVDDNIERLEQLIEETYIQAKGLSHASLNQDYANHILAFVQCSIAYPDQIVQATDGKYYQDNYNGIGDTTIYGVEEYWAYPLQTLNLGQGDCEDTSFLSASLFKAAGYVTGVLVIPGHMVSFVGLNSFQRDPFSGFGFYLTEMILTATQQPIFYCETTMDRYLPVGYTDFSTMQQIKREHQVWLVN